jgi:UDP-apiose/xylose synthase
MGLNKNRICIIGCGGFIGSHLLETLLEETDFKIEGVDPRDEKIRHLACHPRFTFHHRDVYDTGFLNKITHRCRTVISLAAICHPSLYNKEPIAVMESSFQKPLEIVSACIRQKARLIHFSTSEVYGKTASALLPACRANETMSEEATHLILGPIAKERWTYACAKQLLERTIWAYGMRGDLDFTIVRPFNFIGPRMDFLPGVDGSGIPRVFACFMHSLMNGKPLILVNGGKNRRVFTYVKDAAQAVLCMVLNPQKARGQIFNIGNSKNETTILGLAEKMRKIFPHLSGKCLPAGCVLRKQSGLEFYGQGYDDCNRRMPDISKAASLLGWRPHTGLADTIRHSMAGFMEHYRNAVRDG